MFVQSMFRMAFCQKAIVNEACGGDPAKLKRLKVRFAKPVLMGQTLSIDVRRAAEGLAFNATVDGEVVLKDGHAEIG